MPGFEQEVRTLLDRRFPCSALSNIPIYRPDVKENRLIGYEIDHLIHVSSELNDRLIVIECKEKKVTGERQQDAPTDNGSWKVLYVYRHDLKDVERAHLRMHAP